MKKLILSMFSVFALLVCFGCGNESNHSGKTSNQSSPSAPSSSNGSVPDSPVKGVIAYTPQTLSNPFFSVISENIRDEAAKNGYEVLMVDPDYDVKKQSEQIDDFIVKDVTAIVLVPCDRIAVGPAVKQANEAGIPVFTVDSKCDADGVRIEGHVGTDNFQGGELAGKAMIEALGESGGKVLILDLKRANSCVLRVDGFKKVLDAHNEGRSSGKIEVVAELDGNGEEIKGRQSTADTLQVHEDLAGIFAINDPSALGAYRAVEEAHRQDRVKIIAFDGQPEGRQAIKKGQIFAEPMQHPDQMGILIVQMIMKYQAGEDYEEELLIPATLYTKSEADQDPDLK